MHIMDKKPHRMYVSPIVAYNKKTIGKIQMVGAEMIPKCYPVLFNIFDDSNPMGGAFNACAGDFGKRDFSSHFLHQGMPITIILYHVHT